MVHYFYICFLSFLAVGFCSGCARYSANSLLSPSPLVLQEQPITHGLRIYAKALSRSESRKVLGKDVIAKGYQPIQLYVENHTDKSYLFTKNCISLPCTEAKEVAKKLHTSTIARAAGFGVAAVIFSPLFALPGVVESLGSVRANDLLDNDYVAKGAKDLTIYPYSHVNMVLFVSEEDYQNTFSITLVNEKTQIPEKLLAIVD